ncbi:hypothetical protein [Nocardia wallacei]|uniref:hypothetical protein n=1 Tax=Nocardia wallacei TaxID=480035 RepID=UPI0024576A55|nr:hypothetical protein [Nocardia wallacei]
MSEFAGTSNRKSDRARIGGWWEFAVTAVCAVVGILSVGLWLRCVYLVADSRFSSDPLTDPHGYGLIFGTVLGIVAGSVAAVVVPRAFPRQHRHLVRRVATLVFLAASISLITLLVSA